MGAKYPRRGKAIRRSRKVTKGRQFWTHPLATKPKIDIEDLLIWTYRDQNVLCAIGGIVEPIVSGRAGTKRYLVHPDALIVHWWVQRLPVDVQSMVIKHAYGASAPDWYGGSCGPGMNEILRLEYLRWWKALANLARTLLSESPRITEHWVHGPHRDPLPWFSDREKVANWAFTEISREFHWPPGRLPSDDVGTAVSRWRSQGRTREVDRLSAGGALHGG